MSLAAFAVVCLIILAAVFGVSFFCCCRKTQRIYPDGSVKDVTGCRICCCGCCDKSAPYYPPPVAIVQVEPRMMPPGPVYYPPHSPMHWNPSQPVNQPPSYQETQEAEKSVTEEDKRKRKNKKKGEKKRKMDRK